MEINVCLQSLDAFVRFLSECDDAFFRFFLNAPIKLIRLKKEFVTKYLSKLMSITKGSLLYIQSYEKNLSNFGEAACPML